MGENNLVKNFRIIQQGNEPYEQGTLSLHSGSDLDGNIQNLIDVSDDNTSDPEAEGKNSSKVQQRICRLLKQQGNLFLLIQQKLLIILF